MSEEAEINRLHPVNIICDEPNACVGDNVGVSFLALVSSISRGGDEIKLEDGRSCEVKKSFTRL